LQSLPEKKRRKKKGRKGLKNHNPVVHEEKIQSEWFTTPKSFPVR
jgi:hypothetical protein